MMIRKLLVLLLTLGSGPVPAPAQSVAVQQLLLNYQKYLVLKNILTEFQQGYQILHDGYENVRSIAESNFDLHQAYLNSLLAVNPAVANDPSVQETMSDQSNLLSECRGASARFRQDPHFTAEEIG